MGRLRARFTLTARQRSRDTSNDLPPLVDYRVAPRRHMAPGPVSAVQGLQAVPRELRRGGDGLLPHPVAGRGEGTGKDTGEGEEGMNKQQYKALVATWCLVLYQGAGLRRLLGAAASRQRN
mgnify:CR=1 FL=1